MNAILPLRARLKIASREVTAPASLPAPLKGWNTRDEFDAMDPLDAIVLDNFFPDSQGVTVRPGFTQWAAGLGAGPVETLAEWRAGGSATGIGACGGSIFNISGTGAVGPAIATGLANARWQTTNFLSRLFMVNGADPIKIFDGTTLANSAFTGLTGTNPIGVCQYQQRLFFWQAGSVGFWYALLNSLSGALTFYDLSPFCPAGGSLISVTTITHDGGNGVLDFIAFIMSTGEMLLYYGNDPGLASAWQMVGRYRVAPPVNIRALCTYGGDSFVTTFDDYLPLQQQLVALKIGTLPPRSKVSKAVQAAIIANRNAFGWQALYYPKGRMLIFNVPNTDGTFDQHVCNTSLPDQPWCRFKGWNASCFGLFGDNLFFGGAGGNVYLADNGNADLGADIYATGQQAWNKLKSANNKAMPNVRPIVQTSQGDYTFDVGWDYGPLNIQVPEATDGPPLTDDTGAPIDDGTGLAITTGGLGINIGWRVAGGIGTAFSFGMNVCASAPCSWLRTDFRLQASKGL